MIIRVIIKNLFSFRDETEFNLVPGKSQRLKHHKQKIHNKEILKLSAIYGANGAGKSNLVKAIALLKSFVKNGNLPARLRKEKFKLSISAQEEPSELGIEFFYSGKLYFYSISVDDTRVIEEYLCSINPKSNQDELIFHRSIEGGKNSIKLFDGFTEAVENKVLLDLIDSDLLKPDYSLLKLLTTLTNPALERIKPAHEWFIDKLTIILPSTKASQLALMFDKDLMLAEFANNIVCSFGTGIAGFGVERKNLEEFFGDGDLKEIEDITTTLLEDPKKIANLSRSGNETHAINEEGEIITKTLFFEHLSEEDIKIPFSFNEESDGTKRLIEYIPALYDLINNDRTYLIDEIERSIHPVIIKELVSKFSLDPKTKGQLIFTTHESNLLDQEILRTDEIWFAQKNTLGTTKLYSLSEFKEHNTIDIRKGYLNGRYGAIPFIGNLRDLNWNKYAD
jgi:AAA15 family ATPase/GTPase